MTTTETASAQKADQQATDYLRQLDRDTRKETMSESFAEFVVAIRGGYTPTIWADRASQRRLRVALQAMGLWVVPSNETAESERRRWARIRKARRAAAKGVR